MNATAKFWFVHRDELHYTMMSRIAAVGLRLLTVLSASQITEL